MFQQQEQEKQMWPNNWKNATYHEYPNFKEDFSKVKSLVLLDFGRSHLQNVYKQFKNACEELESEAKEISFFTKKVVSIMLMPIRTEDQHSEEVLQEKAAMISTELNAIANQEWIKEFQYITFQIESKIQEMESYWHAGKVLLDDKNDSLKHIQSAIELVQKIRSEDLKNLKERLQICLMNMKTTIHYNVPINSKLYYIF